MYRVGSCSRGPEPDTVLKALIDAYNDGADVVSVSIGWASGFDGFAPHDQVITNGKKRGIATIVAAGNDGAQNGPITMNMPAISKDAIAVACSDTVKFPTTYKVRGSTGEEYRHSSLWPLEGNFHVYAAEDYDDSIGCDWGTSFAAIDEMKKRGWKLFETVYMARNGPPLHS
jgi:subtilisin family serine protease